MDALDHESLAMPNKTNPTNRVILVADDDPLLVMLLEHHLSAAGYRVVSAPDGEAALALLDLESPDAMILDQMMPVMGGLELCRHLKKHPETANIPIVACTVKNRDVDRIWAMKQGVKFYLTKPYTAEELLGAMKEVIG